MGDLHLTQYTEMPGLTVGYKSCQRHQTEKDPTKKSPVRAEDHSCKSCQETHGGLSEHIPTSGTGAEPGLQDPRQDLQSPVSLQKGFSMQCESTRGFLQLCCTDKSTVQTTGIHQEPAPKVQPHQEQAAPAHR